MTEAATFRNQLDALSIKFVADFGRRDPPACSEAYTDDAVLMLPGAAPVRGRTEIAAAFQAGMDAGREYVRSRPSERRVTAALAMLCRPCTGTRAMGL
jgi:ketosteroid isomerase-like protein